MATIDQKEARGALVRVMDGVPSTTASGDHAEGSNADGSGLATITTRWGADFLAISLMTLAATQALMIVLVPIVTNGLRESAGLNDTKIGLLTSIFMGFYAAAAIPAGIAAAHWGGRVLALSCACVIVGSLVFALSSSMSGFAMGRAIQGIGGGMVGPVYAPVLTRALPSKWLGRALGIAGAGWGVGNLVALLVMPSIEHVGGYRAVFFATAGLGFAVVVLALSHRAVRSLPTRRTDTASPHELPRSRGLLTNSRVMLLGLCTMAATATAVGILAWTPSFLQQWHGSGEALSLYLMAGLGVAQFFGSLLGPSAASRWGRYAVIMGSIAVLTIVPVAVGFVPGVPLIFLMAILTGFFSLFLSPSVLSFLPLVVSEPRQVGPATGINTVMGFAGGGLLAPWIFGLLLDAGGQTRNSYVIGYLTLAAFGIVALAGMAFFRQERIRSASSAGDSA